MKSVVESPIVVRVGGILELVGHGSVMQCGIGTELLVIALVLGGEGPVAKQVCYSVLAPRDVRVE